MALTGRMVLSFPGFLFPVHKPLQVLMARVALVEPVEVAAADILLFVSRTARVMAAAVVAAAAKVARVEQVVVAVDRHSRYIYIIMEPVAILSIVY